MCSARQAADSVGTTVMPGTGSTLAFANPRRFRRAATTATRKGFDTLYGDGSGGAGSDLAVFPAADYTPPNLSHFESRDYWFAGALEELQTGWLGRWLDAYGSTSNPLQAISLDSRLSKQIRTAEAPVCAIEDLTGTASRSQNTSVNANAQVAQLAAVPAQPGNEALARARAIYGRDRAGVQTSSPGVSAGQPGSGYPAELRPVPQAAARGDAARREPRNARHHDRLGLIRYPRR